MSVPDQQSTDAATPSAIPTPEDGATAEPKPASEGESFEEQAPSADAATDTQEDRAGTGVPAPKSRRQSFIFFGVLAAVALLADVLSKAWAETTLSKLPTRDPSMVVVDNHLSFTLAYNPGGAWGLFQHASETLRKPFFFTVSLVAIIFIVSLYNRIHERQHALKWGLPLVLGGALGNLADRIVRGKVVDFVDYRADWVTSLNHGLAWLFGLIGKPWHVTDHWPTFNVADISICVGVGLMAVDMLWSKRTPSNDGRKTAQHNAPVNAS